VATHGNEKLRITLDEKELERELNLIQFYLNHKRIQEALLLMREWLISLLLWKQEGDGKEKIWISNRYPAEKLLGIWARLYRQKEVLSDLQQGFAKIFNEVGNLRNKFAHCGFSEDKVREPSEMQGLFERLNEIYNATKASSLKELEYPQKGEGKLLISCLGLSPGLLYTAIKKIKPDGVFLISSSRALEPLEEVLRESVLDNEKILFRYETKDPYQGYMEWESAWKALQGFLFKYREICFNLTGGTSAMQFIIERLCQEAEKMGLEVKRFICIDKRSQEEQKKEPYKLGEVLFLENNEG